MIRIKQALILILVCFFMQANFVLAKNLEINGTTTQLIKEKMTTCTKRGIDMAVEGLKNLQAIAFNFYTTKVAPKADFWVRDITTKIKAGILSSIKEKILNFFNQAEEKFLRPKQEGYWHSYRNALI